MKKIERLLKYLEGGEVRKSDRGGQFDERQTIINEIKKKYRGSFGMDDSLFEGMSNQELIQTFIYDLPYTSHQQDKTPGYYEAKAEEDAAELKPGTDAPDAVEDPGLQEKTKKGLSDNDKAALSTIGGDTAIAAINAVDGATMGDKNFSAGSQAIDAAVHGVSGALTKSGNPYLIAAGVALEGLNFVTKAGGKNVQGYDVGIENSGYGTLGHQDSEAGRIWDNMSNKLAKRNEQARMALAAMDISDDLKYEQEARLNSVTNVLQLNQIALAGGIDTSLLGS